jgi:hypothetical protein
MIAMTKAFEQPQSLFKLLVILVATVILGFASLAPGIAAAAPAPSGNGLKISPVVTNLTLNPGQTQTVTVYVQNVTKSAVKLQVIINDFTASTNESGEPALLLNANQYAPSHSLKRFITPIGDLTLQPGEQKSVNVNVAIPKSASGGGYYGAVRFAPSSSENENNVTLLASVASLVLVRVPGDIKENLRLVSLDVRQGGGNSKFIFTSNKDLVTVARFENKGDVQEQPFGKVLLKQGDKQVAAYELNDALPRGNVLPDSVRKFTVKLDKVGAFGKYTLVGNFGYGNDGQLLSGSTTFYVVPLAAIIIVAAIVILIVFLIFALPKLIRGYNRKIVQRATRR